MLTTTQKAYVKQLLNQEEHRIIRELRRLENNCTDKEIEVWGYTEEDVKRFKELIKQYDYKLTVVLGAAMNF